MVNLMNLLNEYQEISIKQKEYLIANEIDKALEIVGRKNEIFILLQKQSKISNMKQGFIENEQVIEKLISLNTEVVDLMKEQKDKVRLDMDKIKQGQQIQKKYQASQNSESRFFDRTN